MLPPREVTAHELALAQLEAEADAKENPKVGPGEEPGDCGERQAALRHTGTRLRLFFRHRHGFCPRGT